MASNVCHSSGWVQTPQGDYVRVPFICVRQAYGGFVLWMANEWGHPYGWPVDGLGSRTLEECQEHAESIITED